MTSPSLYLQHRRVSLHVKDAESAAVAAIHCCRSAGTSPVCATMGVRLTEDRQCTKAGVECMFYDHGRNELLPRR
jgi:hypothetical protein